LAAVMPGRWAAPPAPAMMTSMPRDSAVEAYSNIKSGVRWADTTRTSNGTPNFVRVSAAWDIVSQSDLDPMMMPTSGCAMLTTIQHRANSRAGLRLGRVHLCLLLALAACAGGPSTFLPLELILSTHDLPARFVAGGPQSRKWMVGLRTLETTLTQTIRNRSMSRPSTGWGAIPTHQKLWPPILLGSLSTSLPHIGKTSRESNSDRVTRPTRFASVACPSSSTGYPSRRAATSSSIPGLSNMPFLGEAFRSKSRVYSKTELVVFLRPTIIQTPDINEDLWLYRTFLESASFVPQSVPRVTPLTGLENTEKGNHHNAAQ